MSEHPNASFTTPLAAQGSVRQHIVIVLVSAALTWQLVPAGLGPAAATSPISSVVPVPPEVDAILRRSCYDCHSNTTAVPWYGAVQPVGSWIAGHVHEGRRELNFDAFGGYRPRRQLRKLEQIAGEVRADAMPLPSYLIMHGDARLDAAEKELLSAWVVTSTAHLRTVFPPDSLSPSR